MELIYVNQDKCARDGLCASVCPARIIKAGNGELPSIVEGGEASCIRCGQCAAVCPSGALEHVSLPMEEFADCQRDAVGPDQIRALMRSRRSVRAYKDQPVERQVLEALFDIARFAPTGVNAQSVAWTVTMDPAKTRRMAEMGAEWMSGVSSRARYNELWSQGEDVILRGAPHVVVAHAPKGYMTSDTDAIIALTYLELAAHAFGLGACWAGLLQWAMIADPRIPAELGLPEGHVPHGALMLGYPKLRYRLAPPRNQAKVTWL